MSGESTNLTSSRRDAAGTLWALLRRRRRPLTVALCAALAFTATTLAVPLLVQQAIDRGITPERAGALLGPSLQIVGCALVSATMFATWSYAGALASRSVEAELRQCLFTRLQQLHLGYHDRVATGALMAGLTTDLQQVHALLEGLPASTAALLLGVGIAIVLVVTSPPLAVLTLLCFPPLAVAIVVLTRRLYPAAGGMQRELGALSGLIEDSFSGIRVIKGLGAERVQQAQLRVAAGHVYDRAIHWSRLRAGYLPLWSLVPAVATAGVLGVGGHLVISGRLTVGELVAINAYLGMLAWPVGAAGTLVLQFQRGLAAAARSTRVLGTTPAIVERPDARPLEGPGEVRFDRVGFAYPGHRDTPVLDGLDLLVPAGSSLALVGASGAGKSTVAQLVARLYDVDAGAVLIDGVDVRDLRLDDLRRSVGIVFQDTFLFADTAFANIAFADPHAARADVERVARVAGAHGFLSALPDGYDTVLGERGFSLSGGQRQRIAIARTLLADPRLLILDDATSAVDATQDSEIRTALRAVMRDRTTIIIGYRPATVALADQVALLDGGRVVAAGTHPALLASSARYRGILAPAGP